MVQWLGLGAVTAGAWVQFPVGEPRSCMLCGRIGKKKVLKKKKKGGCLPGLQRDLGGKRGRPGRTKDLWERIVKTTTASLNELFLSTSYIINSFNLHNTPTRQVLLLCIM